MITKEIEEKLMEFLEENKIVLPRTEIIITKDSKKPGNPDITISINGTLQANE